MNLPLTAGDARARLARIGASIGADIAAGRCDGAALCIERRGELLYESVQGFADRAGGRTLAADDVFVSMSIGKQFTNVMVLACIEQGALAFSTTLAEVLPAFAGAAWRGATIAQLLTHTAGVLARVPTLPPETLMQPARLAAFAAAQGPESPPGEHVNYSILAAHAVLAEIVRTVDGGSRSFAQIVDAELFRPLRMTHTSLGPRADLVARACPVFARYDAPGLLDPRELEGMGAMMHVPGCEIPAGGYLTTLHDLQRFTRMLAQGGSLDGVRLLSPAMLALCARNRTAELPNAMWDYTRELRGWQAWPAYIGLGFFVRGAALTPGPLGNLNGSATLGGFGTGSTGFWADPTTGLGFCFLSTGLMEDSHHIQRLQRLSDMAIAALADDPIAE